MTNRNVLSFCRDSEGNIWLGTDECGLLNLQKRKIRTYTTADGLPDDDVWSVCEGPNGTLWVGSDGGVSRYSGGRFSNYTERDGLSENHIRSLSFDHEGRLWAATRTSAAVLESNVFKSYPFPDRYRSMRMRTIRADLDDDLWIGADAALLKFDSKAKLWSDHLLSDQEIHSIMQDAAGNIWMADSNLGLHQVTAHHSRLFNVANGLMADSVLSLFFDSRGDCWVGTSNGLNKFIYDDSNGNCFVSYPETSGLEICSIIEDSAGFLWLGTTRGIYYIAKSELNARAKNIQSEVIVRCYDESNEVPGIEARGKKSQPAACKTRDGHLWFATTHGLAMIAPERMPRNSSPPSVVIEKAIVDGQDQLENMDLAKGSDAAEITIGPGRGRFLEFHYTAIALVRAETVHFKYRLVGSDREWQESGDRRVAYYTNLRPGKYRFEASACAADGVWQEKIAVFSFVLSPLFYQTLWFQAGLVVLACATALGIHLWRLKYARRLQQMRYASELAAQRERTSMLLHDDLGSDLTQIGRLVEIAEAHSETPATLAAQLKQVREMTDKAKRGMGHLVWALKPGCDNLESLASLIIRHADEFFKPWDIRLRFDIPESLPALVLSTEARHGVFLAVKETLNNIANHAGATEVHISLAVETEEWKLGIQDNGRGFDWANTGDLGNGLNSIQKRIAALGGKTEFLTSPGNGTTVVFTMMKAG
jgi:signal transduction histidine kinase/streptogramin lyase